MIDKGTQNYEDYFPGEALAMPKQLSMVPQVDATAIHKRNEALIKQALLTRNFAAIPRNKIKSIKVPKFDEAKAK